VFCIDKALEGFVISSALIHSRPKKKTYWFLSIVFSIVVMLSCLPAWIPEMDPLVIIMAISSPLTKLVMGITTGTMLWLGAVFMLIDINDDPKPGWGALKGLCFLCGFAASWATSYWS